MDQKQAYGMLTRYVFLVLLVLAFPVIYAFLQPATIYPAVFLIKLAYHNALLLPGTLTIFVNGAYISIVEACIGVAAYYFLLLLNLTTPMSIMTRTKSITFLVLSFLIINIVRIFVFSLLFMSGYAFFDFAHKLTWYIGSTVLVLALWFIAVFLFKIDKIPVYSDITLLLSQIKRAKSKNTV